MEIWLGDSDWTIVRELWHDVHSSVKRSKWTVGFYSCLVSEQAFLLVDSFLTILSDTRSENLQTGTSANPVQTVDVCWYSRTAEHT